MGAGQHRGVVSVSIERVLHDVVPRDMHNVKEQAALKFGQIETAPDLRAVEHDARDTRRQVLRPMSEHAALEIEQAGPQRDVLRAESVPEIAAHEARVMTDAIAQEGEVGGEVERVEVAPRVGENLVGETHVIEAQDLHGLRQQMPYLLHRTLGVEGRDEPRACLAARERGDGLRLATERGTTDILHPLHEHRSDIHARHTIKNNAGLAVSERIVHRYRPGRAQGGEQAARIIRTLGMGQRLEEGVSAGNVAEGGDVEAHGWHLAVWGERTYTSCGNYCAPIHAFPLLESCREIASNSRARGSTFHMPHCAHAMSTPACFMRRLISITAFSISE